MDGLLRILSKVDDSCSGYVSRLKGGLRRRVEENGRADERLYGNGRVRTQ